jgi:phosphoglycolate phosphatase
MHVVLFDIDGTLLSSGGAGKAAFESALLSEFHLPELRGQVAYAGRTDRAIGHDLFQLHEIAATTDNWRRFAQRYVGNLPASLAAHAGKVLPGVVPLLERLRARPDVAMGLLTGNLHAGARVKLGYFGLFEHFAFGGFGDEHLCRDDVARQALAAARRHLDRRFRPDRVWVIGDTPLDVCCARAIGARVIAVATGIYRLGELSAAKPDLLLKDLSDAEALVPLWD